jgi:hypothetical protein
VKNTSRWPRVGGAQCVLCSHGGGRREGTVADVVITTIPCFHLRSSQMQRTTAKQVRMLRYLTMRDMEKPTSTVLYLSFFLVRWLVIADSRLAAATWASCAPLCKTAGPHPRDVAGRRRCS